MSNMERSPDAPPVVGLSPGRREAPPVTPEMVLELLEEDQLFAAKRKPFGRRRLSRGLQALLWILRLYVVFMWVVAVVAALRVGH
jgi:hypothetical protein